jgi:hypothetical protein
LTKVVTCGIICENVTGSSFACGPGLSSGLDILTRSDLFGESYIYLF